MSKHYKPDYILILTVAILVVFGLVMLSSAGLALSQEKYGQPYYFLKHQIVFGVLGGIILATVAYFIPYHFWKKISFLLLILTILALVLVFIPGIGQGFGGARRWITIGPISLQPTEILKLTFIIYLAAWLDKKSKKITEFWGVFLPFLVVMGIIALLIILQPNLGTLGIIALTALAIFFLAGAKISHVILAILGGLGAFWAFVKLAPYRVNRLIIFLHPEKDPKGIGYQINQALLALGSGGLFGVGLGQGHQKFQYLPEPITDSIAAIVGEELGFVGLFFLIILFLIFALRGFKIAKNAPDNFSRLLAGGITSWIIIQMLINLTAICGLIPFTGIPLPFISYGGSALAISLTGVGILLNISRHTSK